MNCKLIIKDEVNIKVDGLAIETRRKIANKLKYDLPYARHMPAYKLGRWDGTMTFFGIGGTGFLAHLDIIIPTITGDGYEIEVIDQIPMSKIKEIQVEMLENVSAEYDETTGKLKWRLTIQSGETAEVSFKFQVKYPKDKNLSNL